MWRAIAFSLLVCTFVVAEPPKSKFDALKKKHESKLEELKTKYDEAVEAEIQRHVAAMLKQVQADPKNAEVPQQAVELLQLGNSEQQATLLKVMKEHHLASATIGYFSWELRNIPHPDVEPLLQQISKDNPDETVRGIATLTLGTRLANFDDEIHEVADVKEAYDQAEKLLSAASKFKGLMPYPPDEVPIEDGEKISDVAKSELKRLAMMRKLMIGQPMPDASLKVDDATVKLSELKGKVVVLKFGAKWCYPCQQMKPHQKEMEKRLDRAKFRYLDVDVELVGNKEVAEAWYVAGIPRVFILDADGIIRFKGTTEPEELDEAVNKLLKK